MHFPKKGVLLSTGPVAEKYWFAGEARLIAEILQLPIYATAGTAQMLKELGIPCVLVEKNDGAGISAMEVIRAGKVDFVINIPRTYDEYGRPDGYLIRHYAVDSDVPLITDLQLARVVIEAMSTMKKEKLGVHAWSDYLNKDHPSIMR